MNLNKLVCGYWTKWLIDLSQETASLWDISMSAMPLVPVTNVWCLYWPSLSHTNCGFIASVHRGSLFFLHLASSPFVSFCRYRGYSPISALHLCKICPSQSLRYLTFPVSAPLVWKSFQSVGHLIHYYKFLHNQDSGGPQPEHLWIGWPTPSEAWPWWSYKVWFGSQSPWLLLYQPSNCSSGCSNFHPHTISCDVKCIHSFLICHSIEVFTKAPTISTSSDEGAVGKDEVVLWCIMTSCIWRLMVP